MLTVSGAFFDIIVYSVMCELYKRVIKKIDDMQICTDISDWKPIVAVYSHLTQKQVSMFISNGIIHKNIITWLSNTLQKTVPICFQYNAVNYRTIFNTARHS